MGNMKWLKLDTQMFSNVKIQLISAMPDGDTILIIWFLLLCTAGLLNRGGAICINDNVPCNEEMLSVMLNRSPETIHRALDIFQMYGMVEIKDGIISICGWENYQSYLSDSEYASKKQKRYRDKKKDVEALQKRYGNGDGNVTIQNTEIQNTESRKSIGHFAPPTVEDVQRYCAEQGYNISADMFIDYYAARGWKLGKGAEMVDWKAAVRTWVNREAQKQKETEDFPF